MSNTHYHVPGKALELCNSFGFLFPGELFTIMALTASLPEEAVAVQLGAGVGTGSLGMVEMRPSLHVYTVDISTGGPFGGMENEINAFRGTGLKVPFQILADSQVIWKDWNIIGHGNGIDLLFIDADHSASGLQRDIDGWLQFVNVGGYVLFHDYNSVNWSEITQVVDKNMDTHRWREVLLVDTLIAFRRLVEYKEIPVSIPVNGKLVTITGPISEPKVKVITKRARK